VDRQPLEDEEAKLRVGDRQPGNWVEESVTAHRKMQERYEMLLMDW